MNIFERNKNELNVFKYDYYPLNCRNWYRNIRQFFRNIKWAWQRATKGYCDRDTWNLDSYYLQLFYHTLKQLAKNTHGYPSAGKFVDTEDADGFEKWQAFISEIADHFENAEEWNEDIQMNKDLLKLYDDMNKYIISYDFKKDKDHKNCYSLDEKYSNKEEYDKAYFKWWTKELEAADYREAEKNIALDMLKEYFFNLWD